ncbi:hypothetical protein AAY473_024380 [Plecturocebus cupreus]
MSLSVYCELRPRACGQESWPKAGVVSIRLAPGCRKRGPHGEECAVGSSGMEGRPGVRHPPVRAPSRCVPGAYRLARSECPGGAAR